MSDISNIIDFQSAPVIAMTSYALSHALEFLKQSKRIPLISHSTIKLNHFIVLVYSFTAAIGIETVWSGYSVTAGGNLSIHLPPATALVHGFWAWWTVQMNIKFMKPSDPVPVVVITKEV